MRDSDCVEFLQWALPRLHMRWAGFRKVRRQVCKRIGRRIAELGLTSLKQYRDRLESDPAEWSRLDSYCHITISRFYRDRRVFDVLGEYVLPQLAKSAAADGRNVTCWCAGCASGEEVYTLKVLWELEIEPLFPRTRLDIIGTDLEPTMIERARRACFSAGSFKDMPASWWELAFERSNRHYRVKDRYREGVHFTLQDIREQAPAGRFDLILCRNLAFTYFAEPLQRAALQRIEGRLRPGGYLVLGAHEDLPPGSREFASLPECSEIYRLKRVAENREDGRDQLSRAADGNTHGPSRSSGNSSSPVRIS